MKRIKKILSLFFLIFLTFIFIFPNAQALSNRTDAVSTNNHTNLTIGSLSFSNITFQNGSSSSSFGLTADVINTSSNDIQYKATIYYYDINYNIMTMESFNNTASQGQSKFNSTSSFSVFENNTVQDIKYYRLEVNIINKQTTNSSLNTQNNTHNQSNSYNSYDYVIDNYDVNIIVNENNTFDITETITAYFNVAKHGIYRKIPLKNKIVRLDGTTSTNRAKITNLNVNNKYKVSVSDGYYNIQIGDENKTLTQAQTYIIKYNYNIGKDPIKNYDEFYFNIIGDEWDTEISNITFSVTLPKKFDASKLGFSSGKQGATTNSNIIYSVNNKTITGKYNGILEPNEALTIRTKLPEGYFASAKSIINFQDYLIYIVPITSLLISLILWFKYGRDNKIIETVEFYPPLGFNSLEIGFLYKGGANNNDVISLLIYLANKGYIQISEIEEKSPSSKQNDFKITKLKEYDGNNENEKIFLEGLFNKSQINLLQNFPSNWLTKALFKKVKEKLNQQFAENNSNSENEVTMTELHNKFYITVNEILNNINKKENKFKIIDKKSLNIQKLVILIAIISIITIIAIPFLGFEYKDKLLSAISFQIIFFIMILFVGLNNTVDDKKVGVIIGLFFCFTTWLGMICPVIIQDSFYMVGHIIGIICIILMTICLKYIPKRTKYGEEILGKIKGFKTYLETTEKDQLEAMVMQSPNYFYDILPYTYVLGISNKWINKFKEITLQPPRWYYGSTSFTVSSFSTSMKKMVSSAQNNMSQSVSSGSSSGGGSSGGGSGGGGGGSW